MSSEESQSTCASSSEHPSSGHRSRLRERFLKTRFNGFSEHEVVELMLTLCIPRRDVKPQAKALLQRFGSLRGVFDATIDELQSVEGVGQIAAVAVKIIREASTLYLESQLIQSEECLRSSADIARYWRARLGGLGHEVFEVAYLDNYYRVLPHGIERLQEGDINRTVVYPRRVMAAALQRCAVGIIVAHNHPSGIPDPSAEDIRLTKALVQAAHALEIQIVDHVIVGHETTFSFRRSGLLSKILATSQASKELDSGRHASLV